MQIRENWDKSTQIFMVHTFDIVHPLIFPMMYCKNVLNMHCYGNDDILLCIHTQRNMSRASRVSFNVVTVCVSVCSGDATATPTAMTNPMKKTVVS